MNSRDGEMTDASGREGFKRNFELGFKLCFKQKIKCPNVPWITKSLYPKQQLDPFSFFAQRSHIVVWLCCAKKLNESTDAALRDDRCH